MGVLQREASSMQSRMSSLGTDTVIPCGDHTYAKCPRYFEGCFDYAPMFCKDARPVSPPPAPAWTAPKQAPAQLWTESPAPNLNSSLSYETQFCIRDACDALEPTQASLCYCHGTANDPNLCDPPLGLALPMAVAAHAACNPAVQSIKMGR
jgi:hypothetical protein